MSGHRDQAAAHIHEFTIFPEGEAVCFGCGDLYIFRGKAELGEYREYAEEVGISVREQDA